MNLNDLYKLAGIPRDDTPAIEPQPVEQVAEQPMDGREDMKAMIALVTPEQLNQIVGNAPVEEEGFANSGDEYAGEPEEYNGTLGSPADLSLRRYLGANGVPVSVDETKVYEDHKVEDITEAWQAYKVEEGELPPGLKAYQEKKKKKDDIDEHHQKDAEGNTIPHDDEVAEQKVAEEPNEGNEFSGELAKAKAAGKKEFKVGDKTYKVESEEAVEKAVEEAVEEAEVVEDENISMLKKLAGI